MIDEWFTFASHPISIHQSFIQWQKVRFCSLDTCMIIQVPPWMVEGSSFHPILYSSINHLYNGGRSAFFPWTLVWSFKFHYEWLKVHLSIPSYIHPILFPILFHAIPCFKTPLITFWDIHIQFHIYALLYSMYTPFIDLDAIPCQTIHLSFQDTNMIISGLVLIVDSLISQPLLNKPNIIQISPELRGIWSNMWSNMFWWYLPYSWTNLNVLGLVWKLWIGTVIYSHCGTSAHLRFQPTSAELSNMEDSETLANVGWSINHISHC
jgi:hypothetical protein